MDTMHPSSSTPPPAHEPSAAERASGLTEPLATAVGARDRCFTCDRFIFFDDKAKRWLHWNPFLDMPVALAVSGLNHHDAELKQVWLPGDPVKASV